MICPLCSRPLTTLANDCFACPQDDGVLISNRHLVNKDPVVVHEVASAEADTAGAIPLRDQDLVCPHCDAAMHRVNYNSTGIIIDTCTTCSYRWLDRGELQKIATFKPKLLAEDMLFLLSVQQQINRSTTSANSNPDVPLSSGIAGGIVRGSVAGNSQRTGGYLLGAGMYTLIESLRTKRGRLLLLLFFIVFGAAGYAIYLQMRAMRWG